jgi:hypothetical protein
VVVETNLSELVAKARNIVPSMGDLTGECAFCGIETIHGHKPAFGDSFCNAPLLRGGTVICPACWHMNTAEIPGAKQSAGKLYRANMWYACESGMGLIRFPKKDGAPTARDLSTIFNLPERTPRQILVDPPEPPFVISLTRTWKKPTWQALIRANGGVATSRDLFPVGFDYEVIYVDRQKLLIDLSYIDMLRSDPLKPGKILLTKGELESGKIGAGGIARMIDAGMDVQSIVGDLRKMANDPGWGLAVYVS